VKSSRLPLLVLAIGVGGILLTVGCNSTTKRKWLTVFFDGVPPEHPVTNVVAAPVSAETNAAAQRTVAAARSEPNYFGHPPFSQEKCSSCHASQTGQGMRKKMPELCFDCHKASWQPPK